jgi:hypothetical protein
VTALHDDLWVDDRLDTAVLITARASRDPRTQTLLIDLKWYRMASGEGPLRTTTVASVDQAAEICRNWLAEFENS